MRVLIGGSAREGDLVDLDDEEAHHVRVRRALEGDSVEVRNGVGLTGDGVLVARNGSWGVRVARARTEMPPASTVIAVAAGDRDRFSWMVEKLGELGVTELVPLESARAMTVASRVRPAHLDKLRRRALESVKQSGASWAPGIRELTTMDALARSG